MKADLEKSFGKIRKLVRNAYENSRVYREHYSVHNFHPSMLRKPEDYFKIPILPRESLKNIGLDEWTTVKKANLHVHTTSGSSGIPVPVAMRKHERAAIEAGVLRCYLRAGLPLRQITLALRDPIDIKSRNIIQKFGFARHEYYSVFEPIESIYNSIADSSDRIVILKGYASDLTALARIHQKENRTFPKVSTVVTDSEVLDETSRNLLQEVFLCPVIDFYAAVECGIIAYQTHGSEAYKLNTKDSLVEGLRLSHDVGENQWDLVITSLRNKTTPLVRYRIGDIVEFEQSWMANPSGLGHRRISKIYGKYLNYISLRDGSYVSAHLLKQELTHLGRVDAFQFVQVSLDEAYLKVVINPAFTELETLQILEAFTSTAFRGQLRVRIEAVEKIERGDARKFQVVKSLVTQNQMDTTTS